MALTPSTSYTQDANDVNAGVVTDTTPDYGTGGNPVRSAAANYLLWCKTDESGNRVFDNPNFGDVLTILVWNVVVTLSGWYERMLMRIEFYDPGTPYVPQVEVNGVVSQYASIVYYGTTNKVYKNILACSGILPTNGTYWEEVVDLSTIIANTNISVTISNTYVRSTVDQKMKEVYAQIGRSCACDDKEVIRANRLDALLIAADSEVENGNYDDMAKIIEYLEQQLKGLLVS
jgi:hypothetical protein